MCKISNIVLFQDTSLDVYMKYTNGLANNWPWLIVIVIVNIRIKACACTSKETI